MMNDQEMQFADPEWRPRQGQNGSYTEVESHSYQPRPINDDRSRSEPPQWEETPGRAYKAQDLPPYQAPPVMSSPYQYRYGQVRPRRRRSPWVWLIGVLIIFAVLGGMMGRFGSSSGSDFWHKGFSAQPHAQFEQTRLFKVGPQPTIVINDPQEDVQVQGSEDQNVVVQTDGPQNAAVNPSPTGLTIAATDPQSGPLVVTVPNNANVVITTDNGNVNVENVSGQMTLSDNSGSIEMQGVTLTGNSTIQSGDGDITFEGQLGASSSYQFISSSGSINLTLPQDSAFSLDATATNGSIDAHDFLPVQIQQTGSGATAHGNVGSAPRPTLTITTDSGDISLNAQ